MAGGLCEREPLDIEGGIGQSGRDAEMRTAMMSKDFARGLKLV